MTIRDGRRIVVCMAMAVVVAQAAFAAEVLIADANRVLKA